MSNINELISKSNISNLKILKLKKYTEIECLFLLKINPLDSNILIEILDFKNNKIKHILLDKKISNIRDFHPIDLEYLYLNADYNGDSDCHLKINLNGQIIFQKKFDTEIYALNYKVILKNFLFREDMKLLNLEDFQEYNLYNFISDNFDDDFNFTYLYFSEDRYEIFSLPDDNILGFEIYDKDGNEPRFYFIILKIISQTEINTIFSGKIEDCGHNYSLSKNIKEIAYRSSYYSSDILKIREISKEKFGNFEQLDIEKNFENKFGNFIEEIIYFDEEKIMLLYPTDREIYDRIKIYNRKNSKLIDTISIDRGTLYQVMDEKMFFIKDSKINYLEI